MANKLSGMIGLCEKAGKLSSGEFSCEKSIKKGLAKLVILSSDASANTRKHFEDMCSYRKIAIITLDNSREELGHMAGKQERAVLSVDDGGFAQGILKIAEGSK